MIGGEDKLLEIRRFLVEKQLLSGGWGALTWSSQTALEATAFSMLALGPGFRDEHERAHQCLLHCQNPNGSWPAFLGDDQEGTWVTALALIALRDALKDIAFLCKGFRWLLQSAGKESSWFWGWKFRTTDRHVRFDPNKFGWPWQPGTNSWVVPTAFAILALNQFPRCWGHQHSELRVQRGIEMLLDRACPGGGWNAGNGVVYGVALAPHPDDTAIALLALKNRVDDAAMVESLEWLERITPTLLAPWSLAWSVLALRAYSRDVDPLINSLTNVVTSVGIQDTATLALVALALDYERSLAILGS